MKNPIAVWCYVVAGWSGFYVMVVELLSARLIAPYFGSSVQVWGAVIFVFMLGLAIGYLLGGLYSRRNPNLTKLCVILALAALSTLPTVLFGSQVLDFILQLGDPTQSVDPRLSIFACFGMYFIPAIFSGMVSPYAIRLIVSDRQSSGRSAGYLYFVSTVGSSAGTLLTSFYFVVWAEVNTILLSSIGVSLAVGTLAALAGRNKESAQP
jgi:MFS family permease